MELMCSQKVRPVYAWLLSLFILLFLGQKEGFTFAFELGKPVDVVKGLATDPNTPLTKRGYTTYVIGNEWSVWNFIFVRFLQMVNGQLILNHGAIQPPVAETMIGKAASFNYQSWNPSENPRDAQTVEDKVYVWHPMVYFPEKKRIGLFKLIISQSPERIGNNRMVPYVFSAKVIFFGFLHTD